MGDATWDMEYARAGEYENALKRIFGTYDMVRIETQNRLLLDVARATEKALNWSDQTCSSEWYCLRAELVDKINAALSTPPAPCKCAELRDKGEGRID